MGVKVQGRSMMAALSWFLAQGKTHLNVQGPGLMLLLFGSHQR